MRNHSLDFLRGIAAIAVCIGHLYYWNNNVTSISSAFILAVDFFLILSGFVITQSIDSKNYFSLPIFIYNRWIRLFPVFILCFLIIGSLKYTFSPDYTLPNTFDFLKYIILGHMLPINLESSFKDPLSIAYTISAELWVGIFIFPIVYYFKKLRFILLIIFAIYSYINLIQYSPSYMDVHYQKFNNYIYFGIVRCILDYSLGILAFLILKKSFIFNEYIKKIQVILPLIFLIYIPINYNKELQYAAPIIFTLLIISLGQRQGPIYKILNNKLGIFLGQISYPIYLIHPLLVGMFTVLKLPLHILTCLIYLTCCIVTSWLIHTYYEKPMMKLMIKKG